MKKRKLDQQHEQYYLKKKHLVERSCIEIETITTMASTEEVIDSILPPMTIHTDSKPSTIRFSPQ